MTPDSPRNETARIQLGYRELAAELLARIERRNDRRRDEIGTPEALAREGAENVHYEFLGPGGTTFEHTDSSRTLITNSAAEYGYFPILDLLLFYDQLSAAPTIDTGSQPSATSADPRPTTMRLVHDLAIHYDRLANRMRDKSGKAYEEVDPLTHTFEGPDNGIFVVPHVEPHEEPIAVLTSSGDEAIVIPLTDLLAWGRDYLASQQAG